MGFCVSWGPTSLLVSSFQISHEGFLPWEQPRTQGGGRGNTHTDSCSSSLCPHLAPTALGWQEPEGRAWAAAS